MIGGPLSINDMSSVMIIASKKDFPLTSYLKYQLIKYPSSVRGTLIQVATEIDKILKGARSNLDQIQTKYRQIPTLMKTALKLLLQASPAMITLMLPRTLSNISQCANESVAVASSTYSPFYAVEDLLSEVLISITQTHAEDEQSRVHCSFRLHT